MQKLFVAKSKIDLERCYPILKELRPQLTHEEFFKIYGEAHQSDGYELVAIELNQVIIAVMGYRFLSDYVRGKHVYIDDLVSTAASRSQGHGAELLRYAEKIALETNCKALRLCTGVDNVRGIQFYEKNSWFKSALAYTKKLN